jgi:hypothetical protein
MLCCADPCWTRTDGSPGVAPHRRPPFRPRFRRPSSASHGHPPRLARGCPSRPRPACSRCRRCRCRCRRSRCRQTRRCCGAQPGQWARLGRWIQKISEAAAAAAAYRRPGSKRVRVGFVDQCVCKYVIKRVRQIWWTLWREILGFEIVNQNTNVFFGGISSSGLSMREWANSPAHLHSV